MSIICPTVTAADARTYRVQIEQVVEFAPRLHIDLADGVLAPTKLLGPEHVWWPAGIKADLHVMYKQPLKHLGALIGLAPSLIILHAEAEGDFREFAAAALQHRIAVGVALLPETPVEYISSALHMIDHVLIFSGRIGYFGGHADLKLLDKVKQLRQLKPQLEIGWDGGVNDKNVSALVQGGVDVLNAGGFIHGARNSAAAYDRLKTLTESV
jgi:ribulose-phosphate 3-epimerase